MNIKHLSMQIIYKHSNILKLLIKVDVYFRVGVGGYRSNSTPFFSVEKQVRLEIGNFSHIINFTKINIQNIFINKMSVF